MPKLTSLILATVVKLLEAGMAAQMRERLGELVEPFATLVPVVRAREQDHRVRAHPDEPLGLGLGRGDEDVGLASELGMTSTRVCRNTRLRLAHVASQWLGVTTTKCGWDMIESRSLRMAAGSRCGSSRS